MRRGSLLGLVPAVLVYLLLGLGGQGLGWVAEVDLHWALAEPPQAWIDWEQGGDRHATESRIGPWTARPARPRETLQLGGWELPWSVNDYSGGLAHWPAAILTRLGLPAELGKSLLIAGGVLVIGGVFRFLSFHAGWGAALAASLLLATDWTQVTMRQLLAGVELQLQLAGILMLWAWWSQRWGGGRHGWWALGLAAGLGLQAKLTFVAPVLALMISALLLRWDRPSGRRPAPQARLLLGILCLVLALLPTLWGAWHASLLPEPQPWSHDRWSLQLERLLGGWQSLSETGSGTRERLQNLLSFWLSPLEWLSAALDTPPASGPSGLRALGWLLVLGGSLLAWTGPREPHPREALLRFLSIYAPLQWLLLAILNRDLHHLAQANPELMAWAALSLQRLGARWLSPRGVLGQGLTIVLSLPLMVSSLSFFQEARQLIPASARPLMLEERQRELSRWLEDQAIEVLWTSDYSLYGLLELGWSVPDPPELRHSWPIFSRLRGAERDRGLESLLRSAQGDHYLCVRPDGPWIYNLNPSQQRLQRASQAAGLELQLRGSLRDERGVWARLYRVEDGRSGR